MSVAARSLWGVQGQERQCIRALSQPSPLRVLPVVERSMLVQAGRSVVRPFGPVYRDQALVHPRSPGPKMGR